MELESKNTLASSSCFSIQFFIAECLHFPLEFVQISCVTHLALGLCLTLVLLFCWVAVEWEIEGAAHAYFATSASITRSIMPATLIYQRSTCNPNGAWSLSEHTHCPNGGLWLYFLVEYFNSACSIGLCKTHEHFIAGFTFFVKQPHGPTHVYLAQCTDIMLMYSEILQVQWIMSTFTSAINALRNHVFPRVAMIAQHPCAQFSKMNLSYMVNFAWMKKLLSDMGRFIFLLCNKPCPVTSVIFALNGCYWMWSITRGMVNVDLEGGIWGWRLFWGTKEASEISNWFWISGLRLLESLRNHNIQMLSVHDFIMCPAGGRAASLYRDSDHNSFLYNPDSIWMVSHQHIVYSFSMLLFFGRWFLIVFRISFRWISPMCDRTCMILIGCSKIYHLCENLPCLWNHQWTPGCLVCSAAWSSLADSETSRAPTCN